MNILIPDVQSIKYLSGDVLLVAESDQVRIYSGGAEQVLTCTVYEPGSCVFNSRLLELRPLRGSIRIEYTESEVHILDGAQHLGHAPKLPLVPVPPPILPGVPNFVLTREQLADIYGKTYDFIYPGDDHPDISGLSVVADGSNILLFRATNAQRVVEYRLELGYPLGVLFDITLPRQAFFDAMELIGGVGTFEIDSEGCILMISDNGALSYRAKLPDQKFINISRVFSPTIGAVVELSPAELLNSLPGPIGKFTLKPGAMLTARNQKGTEAALFECNCSGEPMVVAIDATLFAPILERFAGCEKVLIGFRGPKQLIEITSNELPGYKAGLMPVKTTW